MRKIYFNKNNILGVYSMVDFLIKTGIGWKDESGKLNLIISSVDQYSMNPKDNKFVHSLLLKNQKLNPDKRIKRMNKKLYEYSVNMEWLNYSAKDSEDVPEGEIWLDI